MRRTPAVRESHTKNNKLDGKKDFLRALTNDQEYERLHIPYALKFN